MSDVVWVDELPPDEVAKLLQLLLWELDYTVSRDSNGMLQLEKEKQE